MAPDLLFYPAFDVGEAPARVPDRKVVLALANLYLVRGQLLRLQAA
jgi:hypothetical protein